MTHVIKWQQCKEQEGSATTEGPHDALC